MNSPLAQQVLKQTPVFRQVLECASAVALWVGGGICLKRRSGAALQDAGAPESWLVRGILNQTRAFREVLECASAVALWLGGGICLKRRSGAALQDAGALTQQPDAS